jgi:hypothetical protein
MNAQIFKPHVFNELSKLDKLYGDLHEAGSWFKNGIESAEFHIACAMIIMFDSKRRWTWIELCEWLESECEGDQLPIMRTKNGSGVMAVFFEREIDAIKFYMTHGDKV